MELNLLFLFGISLLLVSNVVPQIIPPRFDKIIDDLSKWRHVDPQLLVRQQILPTYSPETMLKSMLMTSSHNDFDQCLSDVSTIVSGVAEKQMWAIKTIDAWGKPLPAGVLKGNTFWTGNYDECINLFYQVANKSYLPQPISTQYCALAPKPIQTGAQAPPISLTLGLCVPSSCDETMLAVLINQVFNKSEIDETQLTCSGDPENGQESLTAGAIVMITIISLLAFIVLLGTLIDLMKMFTARKFSVDQKPINEVDHWYPYGNGSAKSNLNADETKSLNALITFFHEFSALKTLSHIFTMENKSKSDNFQFINGIRVLSLFAVIGGHSIVFGIGYSSNPIDILSWTRNFFFQLVLNAVLSVDTFFVLSGFLTAYIFNREVERKSGLSFKMMVLYYLHRYIRLTPTFVIMVLFSIHLTPYLGNGPAFPSKQGLESAECRLHYWWTPFVYIGNFFPSEGMCLPITWYLHNDMQFHWIAPITLIPFVLGWKKIAILFGILLTLTGSGAILGILLYYPDMSLNSLTEFGATTSPSFFESIYIKPWCRISPYAIGILTAYLVIYVTRKHRTNRWLKYFLHAIKYSLALLCIFGVYPDYILPSGMDRGILIFYQIASRTVWGIFIGWLLFLGCTNQGGIVTKILSSPIWSPLARLNYSCYLVHSTVISMIYFTQRFPLYFEGHLVVNNIICQIVLSYAAAILVNVFIESPFFIFEKYLFRRK